MPLIRGHYTFHDQFTQIPNSWLRDSRLSLQARGLLAQLMSHAPGWSVTQESLAKANNIGRDAMRSIIKELIEFGYLMVSDKRERNPDGTLGGYIYTTCEPTLNEPTLDEPMLGEPTQAEPTHKNNNLKEEHLLEDNKTSLPKRLPADWKPKENDWQVMAEHFPTLDLKLETHTFRDYWASVAGAKGKKADWDATWRNWMRNAYKRSMMKNTRQLDEEKRRREIEELLAREEQ